MSPEDRDRRRFLKRGAALAGIALGAMRAAKAQAIKSETSETTTKDLRQYGDRSRFEKLTRVLVAPAGGASLTPLQDSMGIITPSSLHYVVTRYRNSPPDIDPAQHRLMIHGMVDRPLVFSLEELKRMPSVSRIRFFECGGNSSPRLRRSAQTAQQTHGWTSCSEWTGVQLSLLLQEAGIQKGGIWLVAEGADAGKQTKSIPMEKAMDDVLVVYGQNGEAIRPDQGYPLRLLVPGWEGVSNVKWLRRIKVVDQPYMTKVENTAYTQLRPGLKGKARWFDFAMGVKSVITRPSVGQSLSGPAFYEITGLAWSGQGTIRKVEVSTDGGRTWKDAQLQEPVHRIAHSRFHFPWRWDGQEAVLQSRCTDDLGQVQPSLVEFAKTWGVAPSYFQSAFAEHFNPIQPWKVNSDGSVHDALFL